MTSEGAVIEQAPSRAAAASASRVVEVEITPTPAQYKQLAADLAVLRRRGAATNTQAILDAVRSAAQTPATA